MSSNSIEGSSLECGDCDLGIQERNKSSISRSAHSKTELHTAMVAAESEVWPSHAHLPLPTFGRIYFCKGGRHPKGTKGEEKGGSGGNISMGGVGKTQIQIMATFQATKLIVLYREVSQ